MSETATGRAAVLELRGVSKVYGQGAAQRPPGLPVNSDTADTPPFSGRKQASSFGLTYARCGGLALELDLTLRRQRVWGNGELVENHRLPALHAGRGIVIEAREVHRSFGQTPALRGASVAAAHGEILAIMGPSGSGKSTLLHCLAGIFTPDRGEIWFDGRRLDTLGESERTRLRRAAFGFVFQFGQLVPELSVADNVALPLLLNRVKRKGAYEKAAAWLHRLQLHGLGGRRTGELSGGEAQRVALARALVTHPRVLFADEPTGSLDSLTGEMVMDLMVGVAREEGTTVILVTHEARVAASADRQISVRDGKVFDPQTTEVGQ